MSAADRVKLTTYRWQAATPNRSWIQPTARNVASTSVVCADSVAARPDLGQRAGVHRAVLADLQPGQVEAERLRLPDQLLQFTERLPGGTRRRQRLLDQRRSARKSAQPG